MLERLVQASHEQTSSRQTEHIFHGAPTSLLQNTDAQTLVCIRITQGIYLKHEYPWPTPMNFDVGSPL